MLVSIDWNVQSAHVIVNVSFIADVAYVKSPAKLSALNG